LKDWSPCYTDEDAYKMGYKNRDDAGLHWCWGKGYDTTDAYQYCGNYYYKFHCTTTKVMPDFVTVDLLSCEVKSELATIEYLLSDSIYNNVASLVDRITPVPNNWVSSFQIMVARWSLDLTDHSYTGTRSNIFTGFD